MNSTMDVPNVPSATSKPKGRFDSNPAPGFTKPRSSGGIPVKFLEDVGAAPGRIDTTMDSAITLNTGASGHKAGVPLNSPMVPVKEG